MRAKVVIVISSLSYGGAERVTVVFAEWLASKGYDVTVITTTQVKGPEYEINSQVTRLKMDGDKTNKKKSHFSEVLKLREIIRKIRPSVILGMGVPMSAYVIPATLGLSVPVVISERNDPANFAGKRSTKIVSKLLMCFASGFLFQTEGALRQYPKTIQKRGQVLPNPVVQSRIPEPYDGVREKKIVNVGRLNSQKNQELLIKAFSDVVKKHPDYTLVIYGEGDDRSKLENLVNELGLVDKVMLPGSTDRVMDEIRDATAFVLSSNFEGMPNALIEAMALGLPVISTDCPSGGPSFLINHEHNGLLVPVRNLPAMADAIKKIIEDRELAIRLGAEATHIRSTLDVNVVCEKWISFLLGENKSVRK